MERATIGLPQRSRDGSMRELALQLALPLTSLEICAGAGGQALGLEQAGFEHRALVEINHWACSTLRQNRPHWNVVEEDLLKFDGSPYFGIDLLAGGVPCPPFSVAGKQLGASDERDLFPQALQLVEETSPKAVMLENVRGLLTPEFNEYRSHIDDYLRFLGYTPEWQLLNASDYGVPQLRPRTLLVALRNDIAPFFSWPEPLPDPAPTVGEALYEEMARNGWEGAAAWAEHASKIAPTLVGGSHKHGGPDLGPTRARKAWEKLGVNGRLIAEDPPEPGFDGLPYLTVRMAALIQGFPRTWDFAGRKTAAYRQVGNAFPPPVARAVGVKIHHAISAARVETFGLVGAA